MSQESSQTWTEYQAEKAKRHQVQVALGHTDVKEETFTEFKAEKERVEKLVDHHIAALKITISDPKLEGSMGSRVLSYAIETPALNYSVRRKFSDFEWLRNLLKERYVGMFIPALVPKLVTSPSLSTGIKRVPLLGGFLFCVGSHEYLREDAATLAFLGLTDSKEWAQYKAQVSTFAGGGDWLTQAEEAVLPADDELAKTLVTYKKKLAFHEAHLKALAAAAKEMAKAAAAKNNAVVGLGLVAKGYADADAASEPHGGTLSKSLEELANAFGGWGLQSEMEPIVYKLVLASGLTYQTLQLAAFRKLVAAYEFSLGELAKKTKKVKDLEGQKEGGKSEIKGGYLSKTKSMDDALGEAIAEQEAEEELVKILKGALFGTEIAKFEADFAAEYRKLVGMVGVGMIKVQADVAKAAWPIAGGDDKEAGRLLTLVQKVHPDFKQLSKIAE